MTQQKFRLGPMLRWASDPVVREQDAIQRAKRKGIARKMEPLKRALAEADIQRIQYRSEELERYMQALDSVRVLHDTVAPTISGEHVSSLLDSPYQPSAQPEIDTYVVTSATVAEAYAYLTQRLPGSNQVVERMLAYSGVKQGHMRTLERPIDVKLSSQSAINAGFDMRDFARIAVTLYEHGSPLHGIVHSHPTSGAPSPSDVDWRLQDLLDEGGYPAIQAVFSQDGYVRFFARKPFNLTVSGKGVEHVDPNTHLYRLVEFSTLPRPGDASSRGRTGVTLRPISAHSGR